MKDFLKDILSIFVPNKNSMKASLTAGSLMLGFTATGFLISYLTLTPAAFAASVPWLALGAPSILLGALAAATLFFMPSVMVRAVEVLYKEDKQTAKATVKEATPELKKELDKETIKNEIVFKNDVKSTNKNLKEAIDQDKTK